jgi:hypothetical protein
LYTPAAGLAQPHSTTFTKQFCGDKVVLASSAVFPASCIM